LVRRIAERRSSSTALSIASSVVPAAGPAGGPPPLLTRTSTPPNASTGRVDEPLEVLRDGQVAADGERAEAVGLPLELVAPPGEHGDVRALGGECLGDSEAHPGGGAANDRGLAAQAEIHG
jgi:hypothetical protein